MHYDVLYKLPNNGLTVAELFCGGGLMAAGLKTSGFNIVWANDFDKNAVKAYRHNIGDHVVHGDITKIDPADIPDVDVIAGGPPCQDYSTAGPNAGENGERGKLVFAYLEIIRKKMPKAFIFENVKGLVNKRHRHTFEKLIEEFNRIGYTVNWKIINAWDYGVAQTRERVFIVGIRKDLGATYEFPEPLLGDYRTQTLRKVIGDLTELGDYIPNHDRYRKSVRSAKYRASNVKSEWDKPNKTIPAQCITHIHPDDTTTTYGEYPRRLTVRECLRLQSVPDWYVIPDDIALSNQYKIVGNGVASRVAWYLGRALAEQLISRGCVDGDFVRIETAS